MALPYYVEPEYWEESYAVGDAKIAGAVIAPSLSVSAAASRIVKWEPEPDTPETWTDIPAASGIWTDVPDTSEIWTEVA